MNDQLKLKIESYLADTMSAEEVVAFEQLIANDPELRAEVDLARQINLHLTDTSGDTDIPETEYVRKMRSYLQGEEAREVQKKIQKVGREYHSNSSKPKRKRSLLIAAAVALMLASTLALLFIQDPGTEQLYAQYYTSSDLPGVVQRDGSNSLLELGALAFQNEEYLEAVAYLEDYKSTTENPIVASYLYKGAAHMELNEFYKAIEEFELAIDSDSMDATKGFWFKAMAYLKAGDELKAKYILKDISEHVWYFNHDKAKELLKSLD